MRDHESFHRKSNYVQLKLSAMGCFISVIKINQANMPESGHFQDINWNSITVTGKNYWLNRLKAKCFFKAGKRKGENKWRKKLGKVKVEINWIRLKCWFSFKAWEVDVSNDFVGAANVRRFELGPMIWNLLEICFTTSVMTIWSINRRTSLFCALVFLSRKEVAS